VVPGLFECIRVIDIAGQLYANTGVCGKEVNRRRWRLCLPCPSHFGQWLVQILKAEPRELPTGIVGSLDLAFMGSHADIDNFLQRVGEINQRTLPQASSFLTPGQK